MRYVTGFLWQFAWFRLLVIRYVRVGLPGCNWLATETPLLISLQQFFLDRGDFPEAAEVGRRLRGAP